MQIVSVLGYLDQAYLLQTTEGPFMLTILAQITV
jgi:hypothetical protein